MDNTIYFSIPDFWTYFNLNIQLLSLFKAERNKFYNNIKLDSIYGSFPCIWNGGRYIDGCFDLNRLKATLSPFNDLGIEIRHTFTNKLITKKDLEDHTGNVILKYSNDHLKKCSVTVASELMKNYIEKNYPNIKVLYSTTLNLSTIEDINKQSKNNTVILSYTVNNNFDLLKKLKYPENIELLVAEECVDNCPYRMLHYNHISEAQMLKDFTDTTFETCPYMNENQYYYNSIPKRDHYIPTEMINNKYLPLGLKKFKISGRSQKIINVIERYVNYLVKPEYKDDIRNRLLLLCINI